MQERLGGDPRHAAAGRAAAAFLATLCGALTQFTVGRMIDRTTLKRVFLPVSVLLVPGLVAVSYAQGWLVLPTAAVVAAAIFGQVTVNETMTARYISPALRARMYSVRFFVGFLGAAGSAPLVAWLYERTGSLATVTLVLAGLRRGDAGLRAGIPGPEGGAAAGAVGGGAQRCWSGGGGRVRSAEVDLPAIVRPVQQRLALPRAAGQVARFAVALDLPDVPADRLPALDLPLVFLRHAAAHVVTAIPLEPAARVIRVDPSLLPPHR